MHEYVKHNYVRKQFPQESFRILHGTFHISLPPVKGNKERIMQHQNGMNLNNCVTVCPDLFNNLIGIVFKFLRDKLPSPKDHV